MYKKLLIIAVLLHYVSTIFCQLPVGEWQVYPSFNTPANITETKNKIYFIADNFLYVYDKEDQSITSLTVKNRLNDYTVKNIYYNYNDKYLVIVYNNSNIDIIDTDEKTYNIPDIKLETLSSSKNINDVSFYNNNIYLATDYGITVLDAKKKEIKETYQFDVQIVSVAIFNNTIYASAGSKGLYHALLTENLIDKKVWNLNTNITATSLVGIPNYLIYTDTAKNTCVFDKEGNTRILQGNFPTIKLYTDYFIINNSFQILKYDFSLNTKAYFIGKSYIDISSFNSENLYWVMTQSGFYSIKDVNGITQYSDTIKLNQTKVIVPLNLTYANDKLYTASGAPFYYKNQGTPGYISILENNNWTNITPDEVPVFMKGFKFGDLYNIVTSPVEPETFFIGTWLEGLYKFKNNKFDKVYNKETTKGILLPLDDWAYRISGLIFDKKNNLWMLNMSKDAATIKILKPDNTWSSLYFKELLGHESLDKLLIPKYSNSTTKFVIANYESAKVKSFIFAFDEGENLDVSYDDKSALLNPFTDQDNNTIESTFYSCIAEDLNGQIWIGTNRGPIIIQNPSAVFNKNFKSTRIKIPRNDGSNFADFLLQSEKINAIVVDGANRKWLGTEKSGLYLVSENGLETIHHFTTGNSPLPSDNIISLAINPTTGEVYAGTDKGLVSYRSDATEGSTDYSNVYAFPNPVRPGYEGWITVTGMQENSLVKITDTSGNLFFQDISKGGQITWNGRNKNGDRVKSGIYLVFASSENGKSGVATKIVVVN